MSVTETSFFIPLRLSDEAHSYAKKFAAEQATPEKAKLVYLNTLAVCAVSSYLQWMEFETDISQGDCWNPVVRRFHDVADLVLPNLGKLECRPVLPGETVISLPVEVREDRLGYVAVGFEEQLDRVKLLGFAPLAGADNPPETIPLARLESFDSLIECLEQLAANPAVALQEEVEVGSEPAPVPAPVPVDLSRWLQNVIDETWQTVQEVLGAERAELVLAARSAPDPDTIPDPDPIIRAERLTLGIPPTGAHLALVVAVRPKAGAERDIRLQVHPTTSDTLPAGLKIAIFDTISGTIFRETQAGKASNWILFPIYGKPGEQFSVRIEQGGASATRNFVI
ncbi:DUF1822 family protein [Kamptonema formosum]|uniref:DUF1822 family protein n=1 Tax=Kamptonema formosum TaxID=331992 RepID=UPI0003619AEF|nr:DUF1822 family protein [Oscillatoria sp. PCC 10802]